MLSRQTSPAGGTCTRKTAAATRRYSSALTGAKAQTRTEAAACGESCTVDRSIRLRQHLQHCAGGIVPGNAADRPTAKRARAAEKNIFPVCLDTPGADIVLAPRERPSRRILKNIAAIHAQRVLDVDRALAFEAKTAITRAGEAVGERFFEPLVDAGQKFRFRLLAHRLIVAREQAPRRIQTEQRHRVKTLFAQF